MEWKYMGSSNAGHLIDAMKCCSEAIGEMETKHQLRKLELAQQHIEEAITGISGTARRCERCGRPTKDYYDLKAWGQRVCQLCWSEFGVPT